MYLEGFLLQASLILALGAQNLFVLESGLTKQRHYFVAAVCSLCDAILIFIGVAGAASIFLQIPVTKVLFGIPGVLFLLYYALLKLYEVYKPKPIGGEQTEMPRTLKAALMMTLGFSLLNPHVYLDTMILIGGYSAKFPFLNERLRFGAGAASFSAIWFFGLASFSSALSRWLNNPRAMRGVALVSGLVLLYLSWKLGFEVYTWIMELLS